jgi:hypothetical protein
LGISENTTSINKKKSGASDVSLGETRVRRNTGKRENFNLLPALFTAVLTRLTPAAPDIATPTLVAAHAVLSETY